jgi:hypothetical protein
MMPLLGKTSVVDDPCLDRTVPLHRRQHKLANFGQYLLVRPLALADKMQQRLMLCRGSFWRRNRRHRLDALAFARHHQTGAIILKRLGPVRMANHARQPFDIRHKPRFTFLRKSAIHLSLLAER